ncbi:hypothetical protein ACQUW5_05010 [Legionella sp. CNM-1927-20]|uniref:hypothetical protein n=1 Tax=Legionella sp. CNM-1927-20 TaxID=3422221 RepID=UPI00403A8C88
MTIIKPALEGIGSASGVAWPIFGILSATLNLCVGSTLAFILGSICSAMFLLISVPLAYLGYQDLKKQQEELKRKKEKYENALLSNLIAFFALLNQYKKLNTTLTLTDFLEKKAQEFEQRNTDEDKLCANFLRYLNSQAIYNFYNPLKPKLFNHVLQKYVKQFLINQLNKNPYSAIEKTKINVAAFQAFVGTFGTIAGGSAGLTGLLMGLGLMASFSIVPWLGVAIILTATIVAIYMANVAARNAELNIDKTFWCKQAKNLNQQTQKLNADMRKLVELNQTIDNEPVSNTSSADRPEVDIKLQDSKVIITEDRSINNQTISNKKITKDNENEKQSHQQDSSTYTSSCSTYQSRFFNSSNLTKENITDQPQELFNVV